MKDIPMYLSNKTRDSIRNRYSHSVEVGAATEALLRATSKRLGEKIDLDFMHLGRIVGLVHDIGHTAYSHDGEAILDGLLRKYTEHFAEPIRFDANINNFRRIEKYGLFEMLPEKMRRYALASLLKRKKDLKLYPEYRYIKTYLEESIALEERYLRSKGVVMRNKTDKTIVCQAMDLADENRYRVTDIIDARNIYSKRKLKSILQEGIRSEVTVEAVRQLVPLRCEEDAKSVKALLLKLLDRRSHAKTEFQNVMNALSLAFCRNFKLESDGKLVAVDQSLERLRNDFARIAATHIWGSKKVKRIKRPYKRYFETVARYMLTQRDAIDLIDSSSYKRELHALLVSDLPDKRKERLRMMLIRNFLGGLTNPKIIELYKKIMLDRLRKSGARLDRKAAKALMRAPMERFETLLKDYELQSGHQK